MLVPVAFMSITMPSVGQKGPLWWRYKIRSCVTVLFIIFFIVFFCPFLFWYVRLEKNVLLSMSRFTYSKRLLLFCTQTISVSAVHNDSFK